jgi:hypothetical protein
MDVDAAQFLSAGDAGPDFVSVGDAALRLFPTACAGTQCQLAQTCDLSSPTTLTGTVFDPAGNFPVYNALVYVPVDPTVLPTLTPGPVCNACGNDEAIQAVAVTTTDGAGNFTLTNVPATDVLPGKPIPLVVQTGHWRRVQMLPEVQACKTTAVPKANSRLPSSATDGAGNQADLPKIAVATGFQDPFECLLLKMGVSPTEFQGGPGANHVSIYPVNGGTMSGAPPAAQLFSNTGTAGPDINDYDIVVLPCEGLSGPDPLPFADQVGAYANAGGHVFATHHSNLWLAMGPVGGAAQMTNPETGIANPFYAAADWNLAAKNASDSLIAAVDPASVSASGFSTWLSDINASSVVGQLPVSAGFADITAVNPPAEPQLDSNVDGGGPPLSFSFDTPLPSPPSDAGAPPDAAPPPLPGSCGRVEFTDFHLAVSETVTGSISCRTDTDCGWGATCNGVVQSTCVPPCDSSTCVPTCTKDADCPGQVCVGGQCTGCYLATDCPTRLCPGGSLGTCSTAPTTLPGTCLQTPMTPQEQALEFMFFDLTACRAAATTSAPLMFTPQTFTEDIPVTCPDPDGGYTDAGFFYTWRQVQWHALIPPTASIQFTVQTADAPTDGGTVDWASLPSAPVATATTSSPFNLPPDVANLDTGDGGAFFAPMPPLVPGNLLHLTVTLNPTSDGLASPTLLWWGVTVDCTASE